MVPSQYWPLKLKTKLRKSLDTILKKNALECDLVE